LNKDVFRTRFRMSESFDYIVKKEDTLGKIAQAYGVELKELMKENELPGLTICPGETIVIPRNGKNGNIFFEEYLIDSYDKLAGIARKCNISVSMLLKYNDVTKLRLGPNQVIRIPKRKSYQIQSGDTLESILLENNLSLEEFVYANLDNWLRPGCKVFIR
jgi:LysM repeat protein